MFQIGYDYYQLTTSDLRAAQFGVGAANLQMRLIESLLSCSELMYSLGKLKSAFAINDNLRFLDNLSYYQNIKERMKIPNASYNLDYEKVLW